MATKLNILLVHGAWADGSQWRHIIPALHILDHKVIAIQNPLTSLADDVARTITLTTTLYGPTLLVGHSYGGMVITQVGHLPNVVGMVYLAAFAPDAGESLSSTYALRETPVGAAYIRPDGNGFLWIDTDQFHENMCQDIDEGEGLVMALAQKPLATRVFTEIGTASLASQTLLVSDLNPR